MRLVLALLVAGSFVATAPSQLHAQKKQRDLITLEEFDKVGKLDMILLDAIKLLRPQFLEMPRGVRTLGGGAMNPVMVVVDGRRGDSQMLLQLQIREVQEVRYLDPSKAQNDYGINANGGAIVVKLIKTKPKPKSPGD